MHFGKTVLASAAAAMPASGSTTPTAEHFSNSISRQHTSSPPAEGGSFISFNPAHPDNIFRAPEEKAQGAQGSLFEKNPSFVELGKYARAGNDVGSSGGVDILINRALRAEALNVLRLYAEGKLEEKIPVLQEAQDYSSFFMAETIIPAAVEFLNLPFEERADAYLYSRIQILVRVLGNFKKDADFTQEEKNIVSLYEKEAQRQQVTPLTPDEREELLREIALIEHENESSNAKDMTAFVRGEAENIAITWLLAQLQRRIMNRWAA